MLVEVYYKSVFFDPSVHPGKICVSLCTFKKEECGLFLRGQRQPVITLEEEERPSQEGFEALIPTDGEMAYDVRHLSVTKKRLLVKPFPLTILASKTTGAVWVQYNTAIAVVTPARK